MGFRYGFQFLNDLVNVPENNFFTLNEGLYAVTASLVTTPLYLYGQPRCLKGIIKLPVPFEWPKISFKMVIPSWINLVIAV